MKKQNHTAKVALIAAAAGAAAAGATIAIYEALKSERGQAGIAKVKTGVQSTAAKVKTGVVDTAAKVKTGVADTAAKVKSKLPRKSTTEAYDDLGLEDEGVVDCEDALEEVLEV